MADRPIDSAPAPLPSPFAPAYQAAPAPPLPAPGEPAAPGDAGDPGAGGEPAAPVGPAGWSRADALLDVLGARGMADADRFVRETRGRVRPPDVQDFFGALAPDPTLGGADQAREARQRLGLPPELPGSLGAALAELEALAGAAPDGAPHHHLGALAAYTRRSLGICGACAEPSLPPWVDRARLLQGQRAFMDRLLPAILALLLKSLPEAYSAARPASVLVLSRTLALHPYHRLLGTLQLLVTVSTPFSFEGPYYPARVAAEQMRLLHAGVRSLVAPAMREPVRAPIDRAEQGFVGPDYELWPGYERFVRPDGRAEVTQVPVSQEDMLATVMAFSLLVVQGLERLRTPFAHDDAEAFYQVWRTFAVLMGIHPPGRPDDPSYVPATLAEADAFWQLYRRRHLAGPTRRTDGYVDRARRENAAGYALMSGHLHMLAHLLHHELRWLGLGERAWMQVPRFYLERMGGEEGAARLGVPPARAGWLLELVLEDAPRLWAALWRRVDPGIHAAASRRFLAALIGQVYGRPLVYPIPHTAADLQRFVMDAPGQRAPGWIRQMD